MTEIKCTHIGFIQKYKNHYKCSKCGKIVPKYILEGISGTWINRNIPPEVEEQIKFENLYQKQNTKGEN